MRDTKKRIGLRRHIRQGRVLLDRLPDQLLGLDTAEQISNAALGYGLDRGLWYEASPWRTLSKVLPRGDVTDADVFADFGCGKGRVLLQAARYPFRKVIGVELSTEVSAIARSNIDRVRRHLRCQDVEVVTADLLEYPIPDDLSIAFCYNPVTGELFRRLLRNLGESLIRHPRPLRLLYFNPWMHDIATQEGWREDRRLSIRMIKCPVDLAIYRKAGPDAIAQPVRVV